MADYRPPAGAELDAAALAALTAHAATDASDAELVAAVATLNTSIGGKQDSSSAATDAELAAAVATITTAFSGKQDASTAATDVELAAAVATINTAIGTKQDVSTAATDTELASAVATINNAVALKQDAATAATDTELVAATGMPRALTGATASTRYVGATASGAPVSGTFAVGDYVIDQTGQVYICTVAGSPGTWQVAGSGTQLAKAANTNGTSPTFTTAADVASVTITFTVGSRPVYVHAYVPLVNNGTTGTTGQILIQTTDGSNVEKGRNAFTQAVASGGFVVNIWEEITTPGTYTRKMRAGNNAASGTVTVFTQLAGGAWIRAITA